MTTQSPAQLLQWPIPLQLLHHQPPHPILFLLFDSLHHIYKPMAVSAPMSPVIPDRTYFPLTCPTMPQVLPPHPHLSPLAKSLASLSRATVVVHQRPKLFHALHQEHSSVLSLAADDRNIYAGSQDGQISVCLAHPFLSASIFILTSPSGVLWQVWDKYTFKLKAVLSGHTGSILALEYAPEKHWLLSASGILCVHRLLHARSHSINPRRQYDPCTLLRFYKDVC